MSQEELRLTCEDFEKDNSPEVLLERFNNGVLSYAMYASSSRKDGQPLGPAPAHTGTA